MMPQITVYSIVSVVVLTCGCDSDASNTDAGLFACSAASDGAVALCTASQVCVVPDCCRQCIPPDDAGACGAGGSSALCATKFPGKPCTTTCVPASPYCVDVPRGCAQSVPCDCLSPTVECGPYGGECLRRANNPSALYCIGCL